MKDYGQPEEQLLVSVFQNIRLRMQSETGMHKFQSDSRVYMHERVQRAQNG